MQDHAIMGLINEYGSGMVVGRFNFGIDANSQMETHYETQHDTSKHFLLSCVSCASKYKNFKSLLKLLLFTMDCCLNIRG